MRKFSELIDFLLQRHKCGKYQLHTGEKVFFSPAPRISPFFRGDRCFSTLRQHLVDSTGGLEKKKPKRNNYQTVRCEAGNRTGTTGRSTNCPPRSSPPPATFSASSCFNSLHFCASPYTVPVLSLSGLFFCVVCFVFLI